MKKLIIALVPFLLLSCCSKPTSISESTNGDIDSTEPSISTATTTTSISTSSKTELRLPSTYTLQRVVNETNYPSFTIEFVNKVDCLVKWSLDGTEFSSHQTYSIKYDQNILYDAIWDMVYFKPNLMEGDVDAPDFFSLCEWKYFSETYNGMCFVTPGLLPGVDENGSICETCDSPGKMIYDFALAE